MKKKIIISVILVLFLAFLWLGYEVYKYHNPDCGFRVGTLVETTDMYLENLAYYVNEKSVFGAPKELWERSYEVIEGADVLRNQIINDYSAPMHVNVTVLESEGQTKVLYEGTAISKANGIEVSVHLEKIFDFTVK